MFEKYIVPDEEPKYVDDPFGLAKYKTSRGDTKESDSMSMEQQELRDQSSMPVSEGLEQSVTEHENSCIPPVQQNYLGYPSQIDLMICKNNLDIARTRGKERIITNEITKRKMNQADIASIGSFQRTFVNISSSGQVVVGKEQFGKDLSGMAGFWVTKCRRLFCLNDDTSSILQVQFCRENMTSTLFLPVEEMNAKSINGAFREAGIAFGFKSAKEKFCRELLIAELLKMAEKVLLPKNHGWYRSKDELCYAYPEDETWEGVKVYAR